jgi:hypothetical protein
MDRRKQLVRDAYDAVADAWGEERRARGQDARERGFIDRFCSALPTGALPCSFPIIRRRSPPQVLAALVD